MSQQFQYLWLKYRAMGWLAMGFQSPAHRIFDEMLRQWPDNAHALASRAHLHAQNKHHSAASNDLARLVRVHPGVAAHWFNYGYALESSEQWQPALDAFARATELDPQLDRAWYGQALVLIRLQRLDEAVAALKRNTALQPMSPYGWYQLARVHVDRHDREAAMKIIRHLRGFEPKVAAQLERETGLHVGAQPS